MNPVALLLALVSVVMGAPVYPPTYVIDQDDYPYQCVCKCDSDSLRISTCVFDKTTPCYCDVPEKPV